ncbi:MAG: hypothetical protein JEZ04_06525 [Spirochaetales bacterium]|nr:hypothetical protein [Spirochaetales bacterium]
MKDEKNFPKEKDRKRTGKGQEKDRKRTGKGILTSSEFILILKLYGVFSRRV